MRYAASLDGTVPLLTLDGSIRTTAVLDDQQLSELTSKLSNTK